MDLLLGEILNLCNFQIVHLGPNSGFIEIISEITWYGFEDFQIYFEYFQCCGDVMMENIVSHCSSIDNNINLINQGAEVCYRWRHMYEKLKEVKVKLGSGTTFKVDFQLFELFIHVAPPITYFYSLINQIYLIIN